MAKLVNFKNIIGGKIRTFEKYGGKIEKYKGKIGDKIGKKRILAKLENLKNLMEKW